MDQDAYRRTYREINERPCVYEKSLLARHCGCSQSKKVCIAEREGLHCVSDEAQVQCNELMEALRKQARFALKSNDEKGTLPHGQAMRLQIGGLRGLYLALNPDEENPPKAIDDVYELITQAKKTFNGLDNLPFQTLIQQVAAYRGRIRGRKKS
jgi:hypothetical protein